MWSDCQLFLKILNGIEILTPIMGLNSVNFLQKMTDNNFKLDLDNNDMHTKFGQILSTHSQDIERKQNSENQSRAFTPSKFCEKCLAIRAITLSKLSKKINN